MRYFLFVTILYFRIFSVFAQQLLPDSDVRICKGQSVTYTVDDGYYIYDNKSKNLLKECTFSPTETLTCDFTIVSIDSDHELVSNFDFSKGNAGFSSDYTYVSTISGTALWNEGKYAIGTQANLYHSYFSACTGPFGDDAEKFMIVNGSPDEGAVIWSQEIEVKPDKYYAFSTWACNVTPNNPARLEFMIDGELMGDYIAPKAGETCKWEEFYTLWYSGSSTSVEVSIINRNTVRNGNDYGLGGISFNPMKEVPLQRNIIVNQPPEIELMGEFDFCENELVKLELDAKNYSNILFFTDGDGTFLETSPISVSYQLGEEDIKNGFFNLKAKAEALEFCSDESTTHVIHIHTTPDFSFEKDTITVKGNSTVLRLEDNYESYLWSTGENNRAIQIMREGNYSVEVSNEYNCKTSDQIYVKFISAEMSVPNVFSPDGNGKNDVFYPVFKGEVYDFEMYIYNRWGNQVYEMKRAIVRNNELKSEGWNGKVNGNYAEVGVYVWVILHGDKQSQGTLTLIR